MVHERFYPWFGESAGSGPENAEQQDQRQGDHEAQGEASDENLPQQRVLELQVHEECHHAEELYDRQYHQGRDDHAAALQTLRDE